jgi:hypothetical protein
MRDLSPNTGGQGISMVKAKYERIDLSIKPGERDKASCYTISLR